MDNNYNFEPFVSQKGRFKPFLSIGEAGGIGISSGFVKKHDANKYTNAKLFYDKNKQAIGIKFLSEKEMGSISTKFYKEGGGAINGKGFFIKYDIDPKKYKGRYEPKEIEQTGEKLYVIELKVKEGK